MFGIWHHPEVLCKVFSNYAPGVKANHIPGPHFQIGHIKITLKKIIFATRRPRAFMYSISNQMFCIKFVENHVTVIKTGHSLSIIILDMHVRY